MAEEKIPQPTFSSGLGDFYFNIKDDDSYPFIFTNIKGPILVNEEDMDAYISEAMKKTSSVKPRNPCQSNSAEDCLNYSTLIPTGWIGSVS